MKVKKLKKKLKSTVELKEILKNPSPKIKVPVYTEEEVEQRTINPGDDIVKNPTLSTRVGALETRFDRLDTRMEQLEVTVKELVTTVTTLAKTVSNGFKRIDNRIDNIEKRLDYNNLKQLPK